jgi:hypothetical protein
MDLNAMSFASDSHRRKQRQFILEHAQTKALNRAIRSILSLHGSMPKAEFAKPFAILRWVPNMSDPDVRRRMLDSLLPATTAAYGPEPEQLGPGETIQAPEAPDDDSVEGELVERHSNGGTHSVDAQTGEVVATSEPDEPDWFDAVDDGPSLCDELRRRATTSSLAGPADATQRPALSTLLSPLGGDAVAAVFREAFDLTDRKSISAAQAQAVLGLAGDEAEAFRRRWAQEAERLGAAT